MKTSWKVAGTLWWLWVFATARTIVCAIQAGRGFDEAATVLGADFEGILVRDAGHPLGNSNARLTKPVWRI
jgi:hypothetical protein